MIHLVALSCYFVNSDHIVSNSSLLLVSEAQAQPPADDAYYTVDENNNNTKILWVDIKDFISVGTSEHVENAIEITSSSSQDFSAIILALDTPGVRWTRRLR
jgi:membrane-bound ClpP family serine protease